MAVEGDSKGLGRAESASDAPAPTPAGIPNAAESPPREERSSHPAEEASDDAAALRREAAGYRRQLRAAESERDALREQIDRRDRADAERLAGQSMAAGGDLWVAGVELAALRDDDGALSPAKVTEAVERVLSEKPHWRRVASVSFDGGARTTLASVPSFGEALKNAGRP